MTVATLVSNVDLYRFGIQREYATDQWQTTNGYTTGYYNSKLCFNWILTHNWEGNIYSFKKAISEPFIISWNLNHTGIGYDEKLSQQWLQSVRSPELWRSTVRIPLPCRSFYTTACHIPEDSTLVKAYQPKKLSCCVWIIRRIFPTSPENTY